MATIKMKRGSGAPSGLTAGEPAFDTTNKHYYVHDGSSAVLVGASIKNNAGATSWDDSVYGDTVLATQYAIDQRIASQISAGGGGFTLAASNGTPQSVVLGSDTLTIAQGDGILTSIGGTDTITITNIGVRSVSAGTGIDVSGSTGAVTISNTGVQSFNGSTGAVSFVNYVSSFNGSTGAITYHPPIATTGATGVASFSSDNFAVSAGGAVTIKDGGVANAELVNSSVTVTAGTGLAGGGAVSLGSSITLSNVGVTSFNGSTGAVSFVDYVSSFNGSTGAISFNNYVSGITGTANEIEVTGNTGSVTIGLPSNVNITSNLVVGGNLTVNGSTVTVDSTTVQIADPVFTLGGTQDVVTNDSKDRGILFRYGTGSVAKSGFMGWERNTSDFHFLDEATFTSEAVDGGTYGRVVADGLQFKSSFTSIISGFLQGTVTGVSKTWTLPDVTGTIITTGDSGTVTNTMLAGSIADSKLSTISTANKVSLSAIDLDGGTETTTIAGTDLLFVDDGANGTNRKVTVNNLFGTGSTAVIDGGSY